MRGHLKRRLPAERWKPKTRAIPTTWAFDGHLMLGRMWSSAARLRVVFTGGCAFAGYLMKVALPLGVHHG